MGVKYSEEFLMRFDGRPLPVGSGLRCFVCGSRDRLDIVRTMGGDGSCGWRPGFCAVCDCGACGLLSETRRGALRGWDALMLEQGVIEESRCDD